MDRNEAFAQLEKDLANQPELLKPCAQALTFLIKQPPQTLRRISFGLLSKAAGFSSSVAAVPVAEYFSSGRFHLLDKQYVLIVDGEEFELTLDDVHQAKKNKVFFHPDRGEEVPNFSDHLFLFFTPSLGGKNVLCGGRG